MSAPADLTRVAADVLGGIGMRRGKFTETTVWVVRRVEDMHTNDERSGASATEAAAATRRRYNAVIDAIPNMCPRQRGTVRMMVRAFAGNQAAVDKVASLSSALFHECPWQPVSDEPVDVEITHMLTMSGVVHTPVRSTNPNHPPPPCITRARWTDVLCSTCTRCLKAPRRYNGSVASGHR